VYDSGQILNKALLGWGRTCKSRSRPSIYS